MNKLFRFGSEVKAKGSLYCIGILFFLCCINLFLERDVLSIYIILESMIVCILVALIEYFLFLNYDKLSKSQRNTRTLIWVLLTNGLIIFTSYIFEWTLEYPFWIKLALVIALEIALFFFRYSIYVKNLYETKELNKKLQKYQLKQ